MRSSAASVKVKLKTNRVKEYLVIGSRKTRAMMRGVSAALASCTATSRAVQTKTMDVNSEEARVPNTVLAVAGSTSETTPISSSIRWSIRTATTAASALSTGRIQMELLK